MASLLRWAEKTARAGLTTILLEWEGTFPFRRHPLIPNKFAYTETEVWRFLDHCENLGLEVIPLQQCFGHVEYILRHDRYAALRESNRDICQLCPCEADAALSLFADLFRELAKVHHAPYLHIGGDETYLLGHCPRCRAKGERSGLSALYIGYFKRIADLAISLGKRPIIWADILLRHPEAAAELPPSTILLDWNYGWKFNKFGNLASLEKSGFEIWGAPALRSAPDNHSLTTWEKHLENFRDYIPYARKKNFRGMIVTSWSTSGLYGYQWEQEGRLQEMHPIRRVYPMEGFDLLFAAFVAALRTESALEPETFVVEYAESHFAFSKKDAQALWKAIRGEAIQIGPTSNIAPILKKARAAKLALSRLKPRKHAAEFDHIRLMIDLRELHLRCKTLEKQIHSHRFAPDKVGAAIKNLDGLLAESTQLHDRFIRLNRESLHPAEMDAELSYRTESLRQLRARLARDGRGSAIQGMKESLSA